jgi:hypothetical protein
MQSREKYKIKPTDVKSQGDISRTQIFQINN